MYAIRSYYVTVIVLLAKKSRKSTNDGAADALKLRFIKGELTEEEYLKMKDVLGKYVITSYSIHYTKLYDTGCGRCLEVCPHRVFQPEPRMHPSMDWLQCLKRLMTGNT